MRRNGAIREHVDLEKWISGENRETCQGSGRPALPLVPREEGRS